MKAKKVVYVERGRGGGMTEIFFKEDKMKRGSQEKEDIVAKALTY